MNNNVSQSLVDKISGFKLQMILNKSLYTDEVITREYYELVESNLLEKIHYLANELEMYI